MDDSRLGTLRERASSRETPIARPILRAARGRRREDARGPGLRSQGRRWTDEADRVGTGVAQALKNRPTPREACRGPRAPAPAPEFKTLEGPGHRILPVRPPPTSPPRRRRRERPDPPPARLRPGRRRMGSNSRRERSGSPGSSTRHTAHRRLLCEPRTRQPRKAARFGEQPDEAAVDSDRVAGRGTRRQRAEPASAGEERGGRGPTPTSQVKGRGP